MGAKERDCENCNLIPVLWKENQLAFEFYALLRSSEPMGISCQGAEIIFNWYGIPKNERLELYQKIMVCWSEEMNLATKKGKKAGF